MAKYARELPLDKNANPYFTTTPGQVSYQAWSGVPASSSVIGLTDTTTVVQIAAIGAAISFKWGPSSVTSSSFDGTVPANTVATYVVPQSVIAASNSVMGANGANGLYNKISIKVATAVSASVFGTEF